MSTIDAKAKGSNPTREQPRGIDVLWLVFLLTVAATLSLRPVAVVDADLWWHLRAGDWIISHHAVPWRDVFGRYTLGHTWIDYTWLFDVLIASLYKLKGLSGILAFTGTLILASVACVFGLLSRRLSQGYALSLSALFLLVIVPLATPRPWLFSMFLLIVELRLLLCASEQNRPYLLVWVVPLFAIWANLHVQFVYGLALLLLFAAVASLPRRYIGSDQHLLRLRVPWWWASLAVAIGATLINPYGWRIYSVVWAYASQKTAVNFIEEMHALAFRSVTDWATLALFSLAVGSFAWSHKRSVLLPAFLLAGGWCGFHTQRDVWFLAVLSVAVTALAFREKTVAKPLNSWQTGIALLLAAGIYLAQLHWGDLSNQKLQQAVDQSFPENASRYIETHASPDPLFNPYDWGGYLMWRLPGRLVSIDGRAQLYGDDGLARFFATRTGAPGWRDSPELQRANTVLAERESPLASLLRMDPAYKLVYEDQSAVIFVHADISNADDRR